MFVIDYASLCRGGNYFARAKIGFVLERKAHDLIEFLWREEFIQDHAPRGQNTGPLGDSGARARNNPGIDARTGRLRLTRRLRLTGRLWLTGNLQRSARRLGLLAGRLRLTGSRCGRRHANTRGLRLTRRLRLTRVRAQFRVE